MKISCRKKIAVDSKKDAILIPVYKNIRSLRLITGKKIDDEIQKIIQSDYFNFEEKESKSFYLDVNKKLKKIYIIHIPKEQEDARFYMELGAKTASIFKKDKISSFSMISFEDIYNEKKDFSSTKAFLEGFMFADYSFENFKSKKSLEHTFEAEIITAMPRLKKYIDDNAEQWNTVFTNINIMKDLINTPANHLTPALFADFVKSNSHHSMKVTIWDEKVIAENNLNLLNAVGISSSNMPRFIHIKYNGAPETNKNIALVGKGITFDSGGSSLKPASSMTTMKTDMSGAALMFTLTKLIAELELKINVNTYIPLAENIIGRDALVPGDVITSASGKTVEILNTDAEGRLILADALYTATKTDPEIIIDAATLTGACIVALGPFCAGLFSNRKFLSKQISDISWEMAEDVWELPLFDGYEHGINSTVADIQNMSTFGREGGALHAALFLKQFVDNYPWIHLDIAGPAYLEKAHPIFGKEATGFGLRLLFQFLKHITQRKIMADIRQKAAENKTIQAFCAKYNRITSYINFPTESSKYSFIVFMIAALAAFFISVNARYDQFDVWKQNKEQFFYENTPMMTTLDAYKYTRHAKELNAGEYVAGGDDIDIFYPEGVPFYDPAPLLSVILAKIHNITGADYYNTAINMVPWLGSIFILAVCLYFYFAGYPALGIITGLLTTFAPVFYGRTSIGRFDTDGGNMFFLFLASLFVLTASKAKKATSLYILSACLGFTMLAFQHFYNHILFNLVYFLVFAVSLFIYNHKYKNILIASLIYILTSNPLVFIDSLSALIGSMAVYIPFLPNNLEANSPIPWVYNTISEAAAESFGGIVNFTILNSLLFILGLIGGILFFTANIKKALPLAPIFAMGFVTFISSGRFAMFLMPVIAAGFGYLIYIASHYIFRKLSMQYKNRSIYINTFAPLLLTIILLSGIFAAKLTAYGMIPGPSIDTSIYALIDKMGKELPDNSTVYTWWDYGLAITDVTGFPVYHSGMSQSTPKTWMIAKSLTGSQKELYNISSYIAKGGYEEVQKMFKDNKTIDEVSNVMTSYDKGPENENIYILFTFDMIQKYSAISYLAGNTEAILTTFCQPGNNNTLLCSNNININVKTGILSANSNNIQLSRLMLTDNGKLTNTQTYTLQMGYSVVLMPAANGFITYILSPSLANSSFVQLFLLQNADEKYFTPVINQYPYGVVYKVKPKDF